MGGLVRVLSTVVTPPLLLASLRKLEKGVVIETAHIALSLAGQVFRYAIATGRAQNNPAVDLAGALEQPQSKHFASVTEPAMIGELQIGRASCRERVCQYV